MKRSDKQTFVEDFKGEVEKAEVFYLTDFTGLDVKSMTVLRREIKETGARYVVVKNRLVTRALGSMEIPDLAEHFTGPTGVVISESGPVAVAKALSDFAKAHAGRPAFKIGVVDNEVLEADQFKRLAALPPREVLLAQLAGSLEAPLAALVGALEGKVQELVGLFEALKTQREEG